MIACLDVFYLKDSARAVCLIFKTLRDIKPLTVYETYIPVVAKYEKGDFTKRELPCLSAVLSLVEEKLSLIIIDGYVWINLGKKGLGAILYENLPQPVPVIGVAKSKFTNAEPMALWPRKIGNPLYVSSIGIELSQALTLLKGLDGQGRIPTILSLTDRHSRRWKKEAKP